MFYCMETFRGVHINTGFPPVPEAVVLVFAWNNRLVYIATTVMTTEVLQHYSANAVFCVVALQYGRLAW